jgi:hypothetical protein
MKLTTGSKRKSDGKIMPEEETPEVRSGDVLVSGGPCKDPLPGIRQAGGGRVSSRCPDLPVYSPSSF